MTIGYQVVTGIAETGSVPGLTTLLANLLAVVASRSPQDPTQCRVGMLTDRLVGNDVSAGLAILRLEEILN